MARISNGRTLGKSCVGTHPTSTDSLPGTCWICQSQKVRTEHNTSTKPLSYSLDSKTHPMCCMILPYSKKRPAQMNRHLSIFQLISAAHAYFRFHVSRSIEIRWYRSRPSILLEGRTSMRYTISTARRRTRSSLSKRCMVNRSLTGSNTP